MNAHYQQEWRVNVWAGILGDKILGPHFLPSRLTAENYLSFLRNDLIELLEEIPLETRQRTWFQHDGAPPHFGRLVRAHLQDTYQHTWIGRGGPVSWPPRSPDLTPLDFYLWGHVKTLVYATECPDANTLRSRIVSAFEEIKEMHVMPDVHRSVARRIAICIQMGGGHVQHLLQMFSKDQLECG